jgi:hypothetical protein
LIVGLTLFAWFISYLSRSSVWEYNILFLNFLFPPSFLEKQDVTGVIIYKAPLIQNWAFQGKCQLCYIGALS